MKENKKDYVQKRKEQLQNLFDMLREFDYERNGKKASIEFLEYVIECFKTY